MWLLNYVANNNSNKTRTERGYVSQSYDGRAHISASSDFAGIPIVSPYGISYNPPNGEETVVITAGGEDISIGTVSKSNSLEPGELMLKSSGGASIALKNDGGVYINGVRY